MSMPIPIPKFNNDRLSSFYYEVLKSRDHERFYSIPENDEYRDQILQIAKFQAKVILDGATDLISYISTKRSQKLYSEMLALLREDYPGPEKNKTIAWALYESIDDSLGCFTVEMQAIAENRFHRLIGLLQDFNVSLYTKKYLHRIAKCYLFGFDEACIIMCRSSLEAAFMQRITRSMCNHYREQNDCDDYDNLSFRIRVAKSMGWFNEAFYTQVAHIKNTANDILHPNRNSPETLTDKLILEVLINTLVCINVLENSEG
jgi:hypothetical protein